MNKLSDEELELKLREFFEANFQYLKETSGHSISMTMKESAFNQLLLFWKKNLELNEKGSISQIKVSVPEQLSPNENIPYVIEGEINVLEKDGKTSFFDITTHSEEEIQQEIDLYKEQLNIYSYVWEDIQQKKIDETFVVSTAIPKELKYAVKINDDKELSEALKNWKLIVPIEHNQELKETALKNFGEVVEKIQNCEFEPQNVSVLSQKLVDGKTFANHVCENCDLKYTCKSYNTFYNNKLL